MSLAELLDHSPPGAWRAALDRSATCAACRQSVCGHSDLEYAGLVPAHRLPTAPLHEAGDLPPAGAVNASAPAGAQCPRAPAGSHALSPTAALHEAGDPLSPTAPLHEAVIPPFHEVHNG